ncbi:MAG TPA: hydrogen peroxide-dependent heme synthase [Chthoniobacteraceae bacterium]|jgi:peroxiredoxin|nr:hydrogen peroxide-dependent heme synthase [Chthoniobacteraceae bacterium]
MTDPISAIIAAEGWHVLHLFYKIEQGAWSLLSPEEQIVARTQLTQLVADIRATKGAQLLVFAMVSPKADLGFMLLCEDLHNANAFEKRLTVSLGADVLSPVFSYLSMTEKSEYTTSEAEYAESLVNEEHLAAGTPEHEAKLVAFRERMTKYLKDRLYPVLPAWPVMCFYPMSKRRGGPGQNWYALSFEERKKLMLGHAKVGRTWHGKILQLITGSTGLDDMEWGVTLLAHDPMDIKGIVYEMRFDEVSAQYAEFGDFFIGLQVPLDELFRRLQL